MIIGTGIDIVDLRRFQAMDSGRIDRLAKRIFTDDELVEYRTLEAVKQLIYIAKIWSIKESISKAFGTGISGNTVWKNISISKTQLGQPVAYFRGALSNPAVICHVSVSHDGDYLISNAVLDNVH